MKKILLTLAILLITSNVAIACGIEGYVKHTDGSNADSTLITTNYGGSTQPSNGRYRIDLGDSVCNKRITVYANRSTVGSYTTPYNKGEFLRVDITMDGSSPVR